MSNENCYKGRSDCSKQLGNLLRPQLTCYFIQSGRVQLVMMALLDKIWFCRWFYYFKCQGKPPS